MSEAFNNEAFWANSAKLSTLKRRRTELAGKIREAREVGGHRLFILYRQQAAVEREIQRRAA